MTANRLLALFSATLLLTVLSGCGGSHPLAGVPQGGFTNASLNGTYAFAVSGTNAGGFFTIAGSFQANGSGTIVTGLEDINSQGAGVLTNLPISGTYSVRADGRTNVTITSTNGTINLELVLFNTSSGLAIRFQNTASASGSVDLQTASAFSLPTLAGSFAINVSGVDNVGNPEGAAGLITFDTVGDITSGVVDDNDNGTVTTNVAVTPAGLAITNPNGGRGTATITTPAAPAGVGTLHFAYYVVDANHLKLIETDAGFPLAGDAFRQTSTSVSGTFAFTMAGATAAGNGIFTTGGVLNTDGAGNIASTSVQDTYNGGTLSSAASANGTYSVSSGRGLMTLNGGLGALHFVFYPSTGGLQMMGTDATIVASGSALAQSGGPFSNSSINGSFGLNFTGVNTINEVDAIAQFTSSGTGTLSGALDVNLGGTLASNLALSGTYSISANGRGTGALNSSAGTVNITLYMVSPTRALFIETDVSQVSIGAFTKQQ